MDGEDQPNPAGRTRSSDSRLTLALILLAFVGGLASMAWVMTHWDLGWSPPQSEAAFPADDNAAAAPANEATLPPPAAADRTADPQAAAMPAPVPVTPEVLDARAADLEQRIMRVSVAAQAASGYANRAEAIMVAFAARRALDAGAPLGYLEGQLRVLFSEAQPKAVATIVNAANEPVTVNKLRAGLEDIHVSLDKGPANQGWWASVVHALGSMAEIRHASEPVAEPEQRLAQARRAVEAGQIEDAITQVAALPAQPAIAQWLEQARRYNEAHRALDVIEAAAILEPRTAPLVPAMSQPNATPAPAKKRN
jgi:hypothetical protein